MNHGIVAYVKISNTVIVISLKAQSYDFCHTIINWKNNSDAPYFGRNGYDSARNRSPFP